MLSYEYRYLLGEVGLRSSREGGALVNVTWGAPLGLTLSTFQLHQCVVPFAVLWIYVGSSNLLSLPPFSFSVIRKINHLKLTTAVSAFTAFCCCHLCVVSKCFHHTQGRPVLIKLGSSFTPSLTLWQQ